ncbi:MAG: hypothetical protein ABIY52_10360 [Gemmatimonadaceae bacterium]
MIAAPFSVAAQVAVTPVVPDSVPAFQRPNGALLRPGVSAYVLTLAKPTGEVVPLGTQVVSVSEATLGGTPAWLIAESRTGTMITTSDSVWLNRADLAPERWSATNGTAMLGASFTRDSAFGALQGYQGRASFAVPVPANVLLSAGMVQRLLELMPLREGYRSTAMLFTVEGLAPSLVAADISVEGAERVNVGGRATDAWRVTVRAGPMERRYWIARDGARLLRTEQALPDGILSAMLQP